MYRLDMDRQDHARRMLATREGQIDDYAASTEALRRWRRGLSPRSDYERDCYREYSQLEAENIDDYVTNVQIPDQLWENYDGPLSYAEFMTEYRDSLRDPPDEGHSEHPPDPGNENGLVEMAFPRRGKEPGPPDPRPDVERARSLRRTLRSARHQAQWSTQPPF
jgi:hypothetical protein